MFAPLHFPARLLALSVAGFFATGLTQAALLETTTPSVLTAFDTQLSTGGTTLIYKANGYSATEGKLVVVTSASTLRGPGVPTGGSTPGQNYASGFGGDQTRDLVLELRINNSTGSLISGNVIIPGEHNTNPALDSWTAAGTVTGFGWADFASATPTSGTFDVRWRVDRYDLSDVAANPGLLNAPVTCNGGTGNGLCGYGYFRIGVGATTGNNAVPFTSTTNGAPVNFGVDWVRGVGLTSTQASNQLGIYDDGIAAANFQAVSSLTADVFVTPVPNPGSLALMGSGLLALLPLARRRSARKLD